MKKSWKLEEVRGRRAGRRNLYIWARVVYPLGVVKWWGDDRATFAVVRNIDPRLRRIMVICPSLYLNAWEISSLVIGWLSRWWYFRSLSRIHSLKRAWARGGIDASWRTQAAWRVLGDGKLPRYSCRSGVFEAWMIWIWSMSLQSCKLENGQKDSQICHEPSRGDSSYGASSSSRFKWLFKESVVSTRGALREVFTYYWIPWSSPSCTFRSVVQALCQWRSILAWDEKVSAGRKILTGHEESITQ